jgi:aspartyl protease
MPGTLAFVVLSSLFAMAAQGHPMGPHRAPAPSAIHVPEEGASVPMLDWGGRPVVEVTIDGKGPYRFILDTGAHMTVIDEAVNEELSLPESESPMGPAVRIGALRFGEIAVQGLVAAVRPLHGLLQGDNAPRGVLSAASFPGYLLVLDFPGRRIALRQGALDAADARTTFSYEASEELPTVPVTVAGTTTRVHLDTGSPEGLTLPTRFLKPLPLKGEPRSVGKARTHMGEYPISAAQVAGPIALGTFALDLPEVSFSDVAPGPVPPIGQIGYEVLRRFVVTFDSKNRRIRFEQT